MAKWDHDDLRDKRAYGYTVLTDKTMKNEDAFDVSADPGRNITLHAPTLLGRPASVLGTQVGGSHYTDCAIQPIEYIWANKLGFSEGNVVKYITRWRTKGGIKDLEKAKHHIALLIEHEQKKTTNLGLGQVLGGNVAAQSAPKTSGL